MAVGPDVSSSTNLGGWINKVGVWSPGERVDWFADDTKTASTSSTSARCRRSR